MTIKIYCDGGSLVDMGLLSDSVDGYTTNPSLCKNIGVTNFRDYAYEVLARVGGKPVSFEVLADDAVGMIEQAHLLSSWAPNVYVKIPIVNTSGELNGGVISALSKAGIKLNITAVMTPEQIDVAIGNLHGDGDIISVFAGRIADTGRDASQIVRYATMRIGRKYQVLWASTREIGNIREAEECRCDIITVSPDLLAKANKLAGKDLDDYSRETVAMFFNDAKGITL